MTQPRRRNYRLLALGTAPILVGLLLRAPPPPSDPVVRTLGEEFRGQVRRTEYLRVASRGALQHSLRTLFWGLFETKFGSNPHTPYMYNTLPLVRGWFPLLSPMWNVYDPRDAVVLVSRIPEAEYFSFTFFALWIADGRTGFPFASLGDSLNHRALRRAGDGEFPGGGGCFAHVVTASSETARLVSEALVRSGLPASAINVVAIPARLTPLGSSLWHGGTFFEVVMRIFHFRNQTAGQEYLASHPPVFYVEGRHNHTGTLPTSYYRDRAHPDNLDETKFFQDGAFSAFGKEVVEGVGRAFRREFGAGSESGSQGGHYNVTTFSPLMIRGLDCLERRHDCLGDCPDATYFGTNIREDREDIPLLHLAPGQLHVVTLVDHRALNTSIYSSVTILRPSNKRSSTLSKSKMDVRSTSLGVTSLDFERDDVDDEREGTGFFVAWAFTRNPAHCDRLRAAKATDGCTVVPESEISLDGYMVYCERMYLNPITGLGPDWKNVLSPVLYALDVDKAPLKLSSPASLYHQMTFPDPIKVEVYHGEPFRPLHIIKTGGESLQNYLDASVSPNLSFQTCRAAATLARNSSAIANDTASSACLLGASAISSILCGLNCECCAEDMLRTEGNGGGFHGVLIRSPRAHALSLFSHSHSAHHTTYGRILSDIPLYLAEGLLRMNEHACGSYCTGSSPEWKVALEEHLLGKDPPAEVERKRPLRLLPLHNTQTHALTCGKSRGSMGQHYRVAGIDLLEPHLEAALSSLRRMEWVGITDLMEPSMCLLHYQANGTLPSVCDCNDPRRWAADYRPLASWKEYRSVRLSHSSLSPELLTQLDDYTKVDRQVFVEAVHLLLGRLRYVELETDTDILSCIDWQTFQKATDYIPVMWQEKLIKSL